MESIKTIQGQADPCQVDERDPDYTFQPVPLKARKGFLSIFFIMLGFTFFSASMSVGAQLGNGFDLAGFIWSVGLGGAILAVYTALLAYIGSDSGYSFDMLARYAFGKQGSKFASVLIGCTQIGWFGVGVAMFAVPVSEIVGLPPFMLVLLAGALMTFTAYFGIESMEWISYISVPLITILGSYSVYLAVSSAGGLASLFDQSSGLSLTAGVSLVIGSFISGGSATPNFSRYARSNKIAVVSTVVAFLIGNSLMFIFGAVGGAFTGQEDIFYVMLAQGLAFAAVIVLGANIWTTNDNALYTGAMGLSNISGQKKRPMVILAGVLGTVSALWLYQHFVGWLNFLNASLPPIGAILIIDYLMHAERYRNARPTEEGVNLLAIVAVLAGAFVGHRVQIGLTSLNSVFVSGLIFYLGTKVKEKGGR